MPSKTKLILVCRINLMRNNNVYQTGSGIFNARCYAERGNATVCRLSVRLSVTFRLENFENNFTAD